MGFRVEDLKPKPPKPQAPPEEEEEEERGQRAFLGEAVDERAGGEEAPPAAAGAAAAAAAAAAAPAAGAAVDGRAPPLPAGRASFEALTPVQQSHYLLDWCEGLKHFFPAQSAPAGGGCFYCAGQAHWSIFCNRVLSAPMRHFAFELRRDILPVEHRKSWAEAREHVEKAFGLVQKYDPQSPRCSITGPGPQLERRHWEVLYDFYRTTQSWLNSSGARNMWPVD